MFILCLLEFYVHISKTENDSVEIKNKKEERRLVYVVQ